MGFKGGCHTLSTCLPVGERPLAIVKRYPYTRSDTCHSLVAWGNHAYFPILSDAATFVRGPESKLVVNDLPGLLIRTVTRSHGVERSQIFFFALPGFSLTS